MQACRWQFAPIRQLGGPSARWSRSTCNNELVMNCMAIFKLKVDLLASLR